MGSEFTPKHSPGPWSWDHSPPRSRPELLDADGLVILEGLDIVGFHPVSIQVGREDAQLIAAAPELYAELKAHEFADGWCRRCGASALKGHADGCTLAAALAKAEGREAGR